LEKAFYGRLEVRYIQLLLELGPFRRNVVDTLGNGFHGDRTHLIQVNEFRNLVINFCNPLLKGGPINLDLVPIRSGLNDNFHEVGLGNHTAYFPLHKPVQFSDFPVVVFAVRVFDELRRGLGSGVTLVIAVIGGVPGTAASAVY